ncbi:MAG: phosphoribosyltransferase family protein [Bacteroidota bacterium]
MFQSFSLHQISHIESIPFEPEIYSKFKFGDGAAARLMGTQLGKSFIATYQHLLLNGQEIVVVPSPYNSIPTASHTMAMYFKDELNFFLYQHKKKSLLDSKIHRYKTYSADYGNLSYEDRVNLISSDTYHIDKAFLTNRTVLLIDDIKITGSHELILRRLIEANAIEGNFIFVYYAALANNKIEPHFENYLNYFYVKDLTFLVNIIKAESFVFNTRIIKYILNSEAGCMPEFIEKIAKEKLNTLIVYAISNDYHLMDEYKNNLQLIIQFTNYGN